jgi:anti-sigma regulatory factor (Ser/Thr protein kinase)
VEATRGESDVLVSVRDYGAWREPRGQHRGRGLKLMRTLMDDVNVRRESTGTTVELRRVIKADGDAG